MKYGVMMNKLQTKKQTFVKRLNINRLKMYEGCMKFNDSLDFLASA